MFLSSIRLKDFLSFKDASLELRPMNVLIGPNASGKSNLIEAIAWLQAAPRDLLSIVQRGGGIRSWLWMGGAVPSPIATLECALREGVLYRLEVSEEARGFIIMRERLQEAAGSAARRQPRIYFDRSFGRVAFGRSLPGRPNGEIPATQSVFAAFKDPADRTPTTRLGIEFERIRVYHEFNTGPYAPARTGVASSAPKDLLQDRGDNLATVLTEMHRNGSDSRIKDYLGRLCESFKDVRTGLDASTVQTYVLEEGLLEPTPAVRLSDGTLKYLCLMSIFFNPKPPPLVCIEEPELGLHPDALQLVAEALIEASAHTQLIVTTHSADLVDALSAVPEDVVVCERDFDGGTQFRRLEPKRLKAWLQRYRLGELWRKGELGGNLW
jgi:predicted ATPase